MLQVCPSNSNLWLTGIGSSLLGGSHITATFTYASLLHKDTLTFFTNWNKDTTNFPSIYGSGVYIPSADINRSVLIYLSLVTQHKVWYGFCEDRKVNNPIVTWKELTTK